MEAVVKAGEGAYPTLQQPCTADFALLTVFAKTHILIP